MDFIGLCARKYEAFFDEVLVEGERYLRGLLAHDSEADTIYQAELSSVGGEQS